MIPRMQKGIGERETTMDLQLVLAILGTILGIMITVNAIKAYKEGRSQWIWLAAGATIILAHSGPHLLQLLERAA